VRTLIVTTLVGALTGAAGIGLLRENLPEPPTQPIRFSHRVHARDAAIGCTSCHAYAERGAIAGIPSMSRCRGCHKFVKSDPDPAVTAELEALTAELAAERPVEWRRVHRLPDHVFFTHKRHVLAGVACKECHGNVETMEAVRQVAPLNMGWCLDCHRRKQAEHLAGRERLTDCVTCHK
jgi:hypothetical protein